MEFARVQGFVWLDEGSSDRLMLRVTLERATSIELVRDESVLALGAASDHIGLAWHADQYTQETIGVNLAMQGWELIGEGEQPDTEESGEGIGRSAIYLVRRV